MADVNVMREYLISLGFGVNKSQFSQFEKFAMGAEKLVAKTGIETAKTITGVAGVIVTAYAAIGAATVGLMDKVAQSDLGYQLTAMKMYMTVDAAKHLTIATEALGHTIDEIAWNPELLARYQNLIKLQERLEKQLGPQFEGRMRNIRDFRFELTRLQVVMQYLAMGVASNVFGRLAKDVPGLQEKLSHLVDYITDRLPQIADQIGSRLAPVILNIAHGAKTIAESLMSFLGLLFDDEKMRKGTLNFENLARAIGHVTTFVTTLVEEMTGVAELLVHIVKIAWYAGQILSGHPIVGGKGIASEFSALKNDAMRHVGNIVTATALDTPLPNVPGGNQGAGGSLNSADLARQLAKQVSMKTGIPADFIFAQWAHETGGFSSRAATHLNNWGGIKNSSGIGYRNFSDPQAFAQFYGNLLMSKRYQGAGVGGAQSTDEFAAALKRGGYYEDSYSSYAAGLRRHDPEYASAGGRSNINVGGVTVHVTEPHATKEEIYTATVRALDDKMGGQAQRNITEFSGAYQ